MQLRNIVYLLLVLAVVGVVPHLGAAVESGAERAVLVVIDIQGFYFEGGALPLEGSDRAAEVAGTLVSAFRAKGWPVVHIQHLPKSAAGPGQDIEPASYRIHPAVAPVAGEIVIGKRFANSFRDTSLAETLEKLGAKKLVVVGMQTHMCLEAAARAAADLGYEVTVVQDACATRDLEFEGTVTPAAEVHASTLATLSGTYANVVNAEQYLREIGPGPTAVSKTAEPASK